MPSAKIDSIVGTVETTAMTETAKPERCFQFSLRKVLLWMLFVALTFSFPLVDAACGTIEWVDRIGQGAGS